MKTILTENEKYEIWLGQSADQEKTILDIREKEKKSKTAIYLNYKDLKNLINNLKHMKHLMEF